MPILFFSNLNNNMLLEARISDTEVGPSSLVLNAWLQSPAGVFIRNTAIYWTNFYNQSAFVGTLTGNIISNQRQLAGATFQFPNGISVDHINNKIYWADQVSDIIIPPPMTPPLVGHIYVADFSDIYISNPRLLGIPSDKLSGPNGIFVDYTQSPHRFYWTNYFGNTIYIGDISDEIVTNIQLLSSNLIPEYTISGPSSIFLIHPIIKSIGQITITIRFLLVILTV
jgi:hypothetical protein